MTTVRRKANIEACERKHRGFCEYNRPTNHTSRPIHACSYRLPKHKKSTIFLKLVADGWLGSRAVSVLDSSAEGLGSNRSRDAVG